jgi:predicted ATPase/class 3 adenylate cyclase
VKDLPAGTITMLFTDIEGSTALLSRLGERYAESLSAHRALMRAAISAWRGREMSTEGDSFYVVFGSAADAVSCAVSAQRTLAGHEWPGGLAVRVRMGMHSGEPAEYEGDYIGMDVHRAARIAAAAHGGQVVMSEATRLLAAPGFPAGISVLDLGFHRLKDIETAERIYQLAGPGLREDFPPLKSLGTPTSLPVPATPLVGRDEDLYRLRAAATEPQVRLVTLTGAGGVGKTRLALAAAAALDRTFPHGVFFVALVAVRDAEMMWKTLADSLDVTGDGTAADAVTGYLSGRRALLVLDNLEQLEGADTVVAALLAATPGVVVLATSRRPLHVPGEHEFPVPPLALATDSGLAAVAASGAARLFAQQAGMVKPGFAVTADNAADIAAICGRLDGLPLAIELAAARVKLLSPRALLARLRQSLDLAGGQAGRPLRQQTLRNTVVWSHDLLAPDAARVFRRMSVFAGGCDLDALAAVAVAGDGPPGGPDALQVAADLADVSLITVTEGADGEPRLGLLETIREYALERLAQAGERDDTRRRHAEHYAAFAERAQEQLHGPAHLTALDRLEAEHDNLRAALSWSLDGADPAGDSARAVTGLRLVQALITFWYRHGHAAEGRRWLERAIAVASDDAAAPLARLKHGLGVLLQQQGELDASVRVLEQSLVIWRELGDREQQARELNSLGATYRNLGQLDTARTLLEESAEIAREIGSYARLATALTNLGEVEVDAGNLDRAGQALREALELDGKQGDLFGVTIDQQALAMVSLRAGRPQEAWDLLSGSLDYVVGSGDADFLANTLELSACITADLGGHLRAARLAGAAEAVRDEAGMPITQADVALLERFLAPARAAVARERWDAELAAGRALTQQDAVTLLRSPSPADDTAR